MEKSKATKLVINVEDTFERRSKRKSEVSSKKTPPNKQPTSRTAKKLRSKKDWRFIISKERWFPGKITTSIEICDLVPTEAEMAMPYMDGVQHNKPIQLEFSWGSHRKESRKGKSVNPAHMSKESVHLVSDIGVRHAHITDDDDDFVDPSRRCEVTSHQETPRADKGLSGPQHSPNEEHHGMQESAVLYDLNVQISEMKSQNKVLTVEMNAIKSQMLNLDSDQAKKIIEIILMKGCPVNEYEEIEAAVVGGEESHVVGGFEKIDEVDAVISDVITASKNVDEEGSPTPELASELPVKRVSRLARILRSPFVTGEGKVSRHDGNVIVFGNYKDHVEEADKLAFLDWFQRRYKPKNRKKFNEHDDQIKSAFSIGLYPVGHKTWFHPLIDAETSLSGVGNFEKDPDYNESECKQMKVTIESTLLQQTNRVFVILYALYIFRDGRCSILHQFDAAKCNLISPRYSTNTGNLM
ncbi:Hypothetical predicted protein [Olea europaea subsp. europaea]|uniref:Uncharacterized protein n=1 Tax=Olea europaea subsp. europaea TaxID=158383 RepID=A0A8S0QVH6_OLEEU|nr:Hypothetical predicted protein [Olea europaea subsp. europaea]